MKPNKIRVSNADEYRKAHVLFYEIGGFRYRDHSSVDDYITKYPFKTPREVVGINDGKITAWNSYYRDTDIIPFSEAGELIQSLFLAKSSITIVDVGDYSAVVSEGGIQVGCQTISFEKLDEIVEASKHFRD
jgi:hypothetical protein